MAIEGGSVKHAPAYPRMQQANNYAARYPQPSTQLFNRQVSTVGHQQSFLPRPPVASFQQPAHYSHHSYVQLPPNSTYNSGNLSVTHLTLPGYPQPFASQGSNTFYLQPGQTFYSQTTVAPFSSSYAAQGQWGGRPAGNHFNPYPQPQRASFKYYAQQQFRPAQPNKPVVTLPKPAAQQTEAPAKLSLEQYFKPEQTARFPDVSEKELSIAKDKLGLSDQKSLNTASLEAAEKTVLESIHSQGEKLKGEKAVVMSDLQNSILADQVLKQGGVHPVTIETMGTDDKYEMAHLLLEGRREEVKTARTVVHRTIKQPEIVTSSSQGSSGLEDSRSPMAQAMSRFILSPRNQILEEELQEAYSDQLEELSSYVEKTNDDVDLEDLLSELELFDDDVIASMSFTDMRTAATRFLDAKHQQIERDYQLLKKIVVR